MKKSSSKKPSPASKNATFPAAKPPHPTAGMSVATALSYFDFSVYPPQPKSTALSNELVHCIGLSLLDGVTAAFVQHDTPTFVQCYEALHYCLGGDMETRRLNFGPPGKVAFLMTAYQAAVLFGHADMVTALFKTCLASPERPIRVGISTPVTMITHVFSIHRKRGSPQEQAEWMAIVDDMIAALVDRLAVVGADELCPTTGLLFEMSISVKSDSDRDVLTRLCNAMSVRHTHLIAQSSNVSLVSNSNDKRL